MWIPRIGDPSVLEVREAEDPEPGPGEVRVHVEAAGVNFADLMARMGLYPDGPPLPAVVGYEVAGDVDAVGEGVDSWWVGAPVLALTRFGGYSSKVCIPVGQVTRRPEGMDARIGAAIPVVYSTAWMALEELGRVREGDRVLVHNAAGGVGLAALDLIQYHGATAIGTASRRKHDWLRSRGYAEVYDHEEDLRKAIGGTVDLVLDPVGGASWAASLDLLREGGRVVGFGFSSNAVGAERSIFTAARNLAAVPWVRLSPISLINQNKGFLGLNMGRMWQASDRVKSWLDTVCELWRAGVVHPEIHAAVPFDQAARAHQMLHDRENIGKVLLIP